MTLVTKMQVLVQFFAPPRNSKTFCHNWLNTVKQVRLHQDQCLRDRQCCAWLHGYQQQVTFQAGHVKSLNVGKSHCFDIFSCSLAGRLELPHPSKNLASTLHPVKAFAFAGCANSLKDGPLEAEESEKDRPGRPTNPQSHGFSWDPKQRRIAVEDRRGVSDNEDQPWPSKICITSLCITLLHYATLLWKPQTQPPGESEALCDPGPKRHCESEEH